MPFLKVVPGIFAFIFIFSPLQLLQSQHVVINEFQASNGNTIADEDGEFEDWIELFNPSDETVNLGGFGLSDNENRPFKWVIPETELEAGAYRLIWASGKDRGHTGEPFHTNFRISAGGEELLLTTPGGTQIDFIPAIPVPRDISYGRKPDGSDTFRFFDTPTPGEPNTTTGYSGVLPPPVFSRESGFFESSFDLELSPHPDTPGVPEIVFTTDGSDPAENPNATIYTDPIQIFGSRVVRAAAQLEDYLSGPASSAHFTQLGTGTPGFSSDLPVIVMQEYNNPVSPDDRTPVSYFFLNRNSGDRTQLTGEADVISLAKANIRGNSSQMFPKKMFGFHLLDDEARNRPEALFGMPEDHNWILYAPYSDKTLMRNMIAYHLGSHFAGGWAPRTTPVELFLHPGLGTLNSSHYHGVYILTERIKWGEGRLNIRKLGPGDNQEPEITGGYIIKKDRLNEGQQGFTTDRGSRLAFVRPQEHDATGAQKTYIRDYMSDFEHVLFSQEFDDPGSGYRAWIDTESFIDHFLLTELLKEIDGYRLSTFMYKDRGQKLVMGPVWDFNLSLGNADYMRGWQTEGWYFTLLPENDCYIGCAVRDWYVRLLQDPAYEQQMRQRWWELRSDIFSEEYLTGLIESKRELLDEAQQRNFIRWPILGEHVWPNWFVGSSWEEELDWMTGWLLQRLEWMDSQLGEPQTPPDMQLHQFFYFTDEMPNNTPLERVYPYFSVDEGARIEFESALEGYPHDSDHPDFRRGSMERRNSPTEENYRPEGNGMDPYNADQMRGLQLRQPFALNDREHELHVLLPSDSISGLNFSFAAKDEGAAERLHIEYSVAEGEPVWQTDGLNEHVFQLHDSYRTYSLDFRLIEEADFNPNFRVRIRFDGPDMEADNGGRVTFNNMALDFNQNPTWNPGEPPEQPKALQLLQNYPNPFNSSTTFEFSLPQDGYAELEIYTVLGQRISRPLAEQLEAGTHTVSFDASRLASGIYFFRLTHNGRSISRSMSLIK